MALRDDLQNQREAIDVVRTELDEATQKQHIVTEDFDRYRQSTEEHNKVGFSIMEKCVIKIYMS